MHNRPIWEHESKRSNKEGKKERRTMRDEIVRDERPTGLSVGWFTSEMARGKEQRGNAMRWVRGRKYKKEKGRKSGRQTVSLK